MRALIGIDLGGVMKQKIVAALIFAFIGVAVFFNYYVQAKNENYFFLTTIGQSDEAREVVLSTEIENDVEIYNIITALLHKYRGNIYCFDIEQVSGSNQYTKYIFAKNLQAFDQLPLREGRFFTADEMESGLFLSTKRTGSIEQIGWIDSFSKDMNFQVKTLKSYVDSHTNAFQKSFILQLLIP